MSFARQAAATVIGSIAFSTLLSCAAEMRVERAPETAIQPDMLVDGFVADGEFTVAAQMTGDLLGAPLASQQGFDSPEIGAREVLIAARARAPAVTFLNGFARPVAAWARGEVALELSRDRAAMPAERTGDLGLVEPLLSQHSKHIPHRSDLPIFGRGGDDEWPQHFYDDDSFGCTSRVAFGDWVFRERGAEVEDDVLWYRFSNYGVFHCWANTFRAFERARLDGADFHPSFFAFLGSTSVNGSDIELWTVQIGARPGSEYLLLSRVPAKGLIETFNVLQTECPRANVRDAGSLDILLTRYCAVNSRRELIRLARRMVRRPPLGTLTRVPVDEEVEEDAHEQGC